MKASKCTKIAHEHSTKVHGTLLFAIKDSVAILREMFATLLYVENMECSSQY